MKPIAEQLNDLIETKGLIKQSIENHNIDLTDIPFTQYPQKISEIVGEPYPVAQDIDSIVVTQVELDDIMTAGELVKLERTLPLVFSEFEKTANMNPQVKDNYGVALSGDGQKLFITTYSDSEYVSVYHWNATNNRYELQSNQFEWGLNKDSRPYKICASRDGNVFATWASGITFFVYEFDSIIQKYKRRAIPQSGIQSSSSSIINSQFYMTPLGQYIVIGSAQFKVQIFRWNEDINRYEIVNIDGSIGGYPTISDDGQILIISGVANYSGGARIITYKFNVINDRYEISQTIAPPVISMYAPWRSCATSDCKRLIVGYSRIPSSCPTYPAPPFIAFEFDHENDTYERLDDVPNPDDLWSNDVAVSDDGFILAVLLTDNPISPSLRFYKFNNTLKKYELAHIPNINIQPDWNSVENGTQQICLSDNGAYVAWVQNTGEYNPLPGEVPLGCATYTSIPRELSYVAKKVEVGVQYLNTTNMVALGTLLSGGVQGNKSDFVAVWWDDLFEVT